MDYSVLFRAFFVFFLIVLKLNWQLLHHPFCEFGCAFKSLAHAIVNLSPLLTFYIYAGEVCRGL